MIQIPLLNVPSEDDEPYLIPADALVRALPVDVPKELCAAIIRLVHASDSAINSYHELLDAAIPWLANMHECPLRNQIRLSTHAWNIINNSYSIKRTLFHKNFPIKIFDHYSSKFENIQDLRNPFNHLYETIGNHAKSKAIDRSIFGKIVFPFSIADYPGHGTLLGQSQAIFGSFQNEKIEINFDKRKMRRVIDHVHLTAFNESVDLSQISITISQIIYELENKIRIEFGQNYFDNPNPPAKRMAFLGFTVKRDFSKDAQQSPLNPPAPALQA